MRRDLSSTLERCAVPRCRKPAAFRVINVWFTRYPDETEHQNLDAKCPYICRDHMVENEVYAAATPKDLGRHTVYLYTSGPQGHYPSTHYDPLIATNDLIYERRELSAVEDTALLRILGELRARPEEIFRLSPREFEQIVAEIFREQKFEVVLTPATRDGGVDIYAGKCDMTGSSLYVIECKHSTGFAKVGVGAVQRIYGVAQQKNANKAVLVTNSTFSDGARSVASSLSYVVSLADYINLKSWLRAR